MDPCILLADRIEETLNRGIQVNFDTCHFIDSTFGCTSIKALDGVVRNAGDCERDALLDLLFSPDEAVQIKIEDLLTVYPFQKKDEAKIAAQLVCRNLIPPFSFSEYHQTLTIKMPDFCAGLFVVRLKIWKKLNRNLSGVICRSLTGDLRKQVMVGLRNSRFEQTRDRVDFLSCLIAKTAENRREFRICFDFLLIFFDALEPGTDIYNALRDKKKFYFRQLQAARKYASDLRKSNMETMMLRGLQCPSFNIATIHRNMKTIDRISRICFGRSEYFETAGGVSCGGRLETNDLHTIVDLLS